MESNECTECDWGTVARYRVTATQEIVQFCDECEAVWDAEEDRTSPSVTTIEQFLTVRGLPLLRSGLVPLV
ncbi:MULTISPECIES: hypothetical protein [Kocuria]|uniref:Uncharacterized protein n=1 Tax=Kocuria oceani TaxID=988827 RepID=A0ABV9TF26_9MICC|nr:MULTISPECIES: hypothetical protein [Kocuria]KLU09154.1 hypothetical protein ABL57_13810 [Kocuria sp. SM24M-10]OLT05458.1 hypothetical protein BJF77_03690 [Kocuria sp. CNJ-770]